MSFRTHAVEQSLEIIRNRIDEFGVAEPVIIRQGEAEIVVQLPGVKDPKRALDLIGKTAQLEFKRVADAAGINLGLLAEEIRLAGQWDGKWTDVEEVEKLNIADCESGNGNIRHTDVSVGDFLGRFAGYPQGSARGIVRPRSHMKKDQKNYGPVAKALINNATACAEIIGLDDTDLKREIEDHVPHCGTAGKSVEEHLTAIGGIVLFFFADDLFRVLLPLGAG